jgi:pyruvate dehydrogenase E2 component (dihydrolipoamide acetyltransferase)
VIEFRLPDVGEGLHEAELVAWHVGVGDHVVADQPLVSIETDKAVVEIPSPRSGYISALHGAPGDIIETGALLVEYLDGERPDSGSVVGSAPAVSPVASAPNPAARRSGRTGAPVADVRATPAVRALAAQRGVELSRVAPSGVDGTITRADIEAAVGAASQAGTIDGTLEPLRGVRRVMEANMTMSHREVVPATVTDEADIGDWSDGTDVTARLVRAVAAACAAEPALNASYRGRDQGRVINDRVDLGVAVDTPDGLFVPVIRNAAGRTNEDIRSELLRLKEAVRNRTVPPEDLRGPTITLSNFGVFAGRHANLVVVPPQVAIVGAGRAREAPVSLRGTIVVTRLLPLSITFDHRVVLGGEATRFLRVLLDDLQLAD